MSSSHRPIVQSQKIKVHTFQIKSPPLKDNLEEKGNYNSTFQRELYILKGVFVNIKNHLEQKVKNYIMQRMLTKLRKEMKEKSF